MGLAALLSADELRGATELHLHNFMIDLDWMCEECPGLAAFCAAASTAGIHAPARRVRVFHGDGRPPRSAAVGGGRVDCFAPPHEQYGTHHSKAPHRPCLPSRLACLGSTPCTIEAHPPPAASPAPPCLPSASPPPRRPAPSSPPPPKAIVIVRPERLSVHVTTANFIFPDWKSKTNAVASFHFGRLAGAAPAAPADGFGSDLLEYYAALKAIGARPPPAWKVDKGQRPPTDAECAAWAALPLGWLADYDYSGARARLVASVPGTSAGVSAGRHAGPALHRCGRGSTGPTWPQDASGAWGVRRRWHRPGCPVAALCRPLAGILPAPCRPLPAPAGWKPPHAHGTMTPARHRAAAVRRSHLPNAPPGLA